MRVGISLQVAASMAIVALFVTFVVGEYERRTASQQLNLQLDEQAALTVSLVSGLLIEAIIVQDTPVLESAIKTAIDLNPKLHSIRLIGSDGLDLAKVTSSTERNSSDLTVFKDSINFQGESFGSMIVEWSTAEGKIFVDQSVKRAQLTTISTVASLSLLFLALINRLVTRPLYLIQLRMSQAANGQKSEVYNPPWFVSRELRIVDQTVSLLEESFVERDEREFAMERMVNERSEADKRERKLILEAANRDKAIAQEQTEIAMTKKKQLERIEEFNQAVSTIVEDAAAGILSDRLVLENNSDELTQTSLAINHLLDNIAESLDATRGSLGRLASGNLREEMTGEFSGIFGDLQSSVNTTFQTLSELIEEISLTGMSVTSAAIGIEESSNDLNIRTVKNAAKVNKTLLAVDDIASTSLIISDKSTLVNSDANVARELARNGLYVAKSAVNSMGKINDASRKIEGTIGGIQKIADQIRMLAINARIEASKAGEFGRGFSVIAAEVGALAESSSTAVDEIESVLEETLNAIESGVNQVTDMGDSIEEIVTSTNNILDQMEEISLSIKPQSDQLSEIKAVLNEIGHSTEADSALCEELTLATESLRRRSQELENQMSRFKVNDARALRRLDDDGNQRVAVAS